MRLETPGDVRQYARRAMFAALWPYPPPLGRQTMHYHGLVVVHD